MMSLRKSEMVRKSGVLLAKPAATGSQARMSSWRRWAMRREEDTPVQVAVTVQSGSTLADHHPGIIGRAAPLEPGPGSGQ